MMLFFAEPKKEEIVQKSVLSKNGKEFERKKFVVICSVCKEKIASPANNVSYKYCYNCGTPFKELVNAKVLREIKKAS